MLSFRQKIFLSYVIVFLVFMALMSPFSSLIVGRVVEKAMENRAVELIERIKTAPNNEMMLRKLKELKPLIFFRISVITDTRKVLYDSHTKRLLGPRFSQEHVVDHPEVLQALKYGVGYSEDYSDILAQKFAYTAVAFDFHGKTYVMRTAFPYRYVKELISDFEAGFIILSSIVLILFSLMTWVIINKLTKPLQSIITAVSTYREGVYSPLAELRGLAATTTGDAGKLAETLVSLSERVERQIFTLRDERNEKEVLLESLVEGVIATDPKMQVTFVNESALKFLGLPKEKVLGCPFESLGKPQAYRLLLDCQSKQMVVVEALGETIDGVEHYFEVVAAPKRDHTGGILVIQDKSDHYRILEMRKDFIANASHELKTPITIIRGFAETLHDNPDLPDEVMEDVTSKIVKNCERMATLVRDLLALADIENIPASRLSTFNVVDLANKVKNTLLEVHADAEIIIDADDKSRLEISADYDLIEMAFINLMQNAIKYSNPPAHVEVHMVRTNNELLIKISDKGIGIPKEDLDRIFERFYRVDKARSRKVGGSGLGLSIVENIIKKHSGRIEVTSEVGKGTTFIITMPLKMSS
jgi:two-component system phosphate regulon sensor histidine kinase PhoR